MDVSLDEIIKRNKISTLKSRRARQPAAQNDKKGSGDAKAKANRKPVMKSRVTVRGGAPLKQQGGAVVKKKKVSDLRMLIGGKAVRGAAPAVRDAREKLNKVSRVSDAREKLISRSVASFNAEMAMRNRRNAPAGARRKLESRKPAYMDLEEARLKRRSSGGSLLYRTVDNDAGYLRDYRPTVAPISRPLHPLAVVNRPNTTPLIHDSWLQPSIQDITRFQTLSRTFNQDDVWAQPQIPRRSTNGIKRRLDREEEIPHTQGYRIVVSNLQTTVTHEDIKELFEDVGNLYSSRVVRPGTAEVVYKNMEDAIRAVDIYHNRQLDGHPMKCLLVKPRVKSQAVELHKNTSNMNRLMSKGSVIPDLHAIHKALFNK